MADTSKVLAQGYPAGATLTSLYTVPAGTSAVISTLVVCNQSAGNLSFRVAVAVGGAANAAAQYLYYDLNCAANDSFAATLGVTLAAGDVLRVYSSGVGLSFNVFGIEIT